MRTHTKTRPEDKFLLNAVEQFLPLEMDKLLLNVKSKSLPREVTAALGVHR